MFRSRRSNLVKRLWKCRQKACQDETQGTTETPEELEVKSVIHSVLKRLKERQLEVLVQSVESKGGERTECVLLPKQDLRLGRRSVAPQVLCCQIWRWLDLDQEYDLKRLTTCTSADELSYICCNPFHWSRLTVPDSPPPPYSRAVIERVFKQDGPVETGEETLVSTETGGTPTAFRNHTGGSITNGAGRGSYWCNIAYWEHRQRVGRLFTVCDPTVNVFQELPHGDGMCLSVLQQETKSDSVKRTREKIGFGVTLSKEPDGVWLYNRSAYPVFVNSPTLDIPNSRTLVVHKVPPGFSIKIFDYDRSLLLERTRERPGEEDGPYDPNSIRVSFGKGWGPCYSRQIILSCPCWIEILLRVNR